MLIQPLTLSSPIRFGLTRTDAILLGVVVVAHTLLILWLARHPQRRPVPKPAVVMQVAWITPSAAPTYPALPARPRTLPLNPRRNTPARTIRPHPTQPILSSPQGDPATPTPLIDDPKTHSEPPTHAAEAATTAHSESTDHAPSERTADDGPHFRPDYLRNPSPEYPRLSRDLNEQGRVMLRVFVTPDGHPADVLLHQTSHFARLDASAISAVRNWRFIPARQGVAPVASWVIIPIDFSLRNG